MHPTLRLRGPGAALHSHGPVVPHLRGGVEVRSTEVLEALPDRVGLRGGREGGAVIRGGVEDKDLGPTAPRSWKPCLTAWVGELGG